MSFDLKELIEEFTDAVEEIVTPLLGRIRTLEDTVTTLRAAPSMTDAVVDAKGALVLMMSNGSTKRLEFAADVEPIDVTRIAQKVSEIITVPATETIREVPRDDTDTIIEVMRELITSEVSRVVGEIPPAEPGKSITLEDVRPVINEAVQELGVRSDETIRMGLVEAATVIDDLRKAVNGLRQPADGKSVTVEDVAPMVEDMVKKAVAAIPAPKDGVGMAGGMVDREGDLIITLSNGETLRLGHVVGENGKDGKDGRDGFGFDDVVARANGDNEIALVFERDGITKEFNIHFPVMVYRGYWREGMKCKAGEVVTNEGTGWVALRDTDKKPGLSVRDDWSILARKGRDGKDGRNGTDKTAPVKTGGDNA